MGQRAVEAFLSAPIGSGAWKLGHAKRVSVTSGETRLRPLKLRTSERGKWGGLARALGTIKCAQQSSESALPTSMSRRANCWDNAVAESFFGSLKKERIKKRIYADRQTAALDVSEYIEGFYNPIRRHSHVGGVSPIEFEAVHRHRRSGVH